MMNTANDKIRKELLDAIDRLDELSRIPGLSLKILRQAQDRVSKLTDMLDGSDLKRNVSGASMVQCLLWVLVFQLLVVNSIMAWDRLIEVVR